MDKDFYITEEALNKNVLTPLSRGLMPCTLGYAINITQFNRIAYAASVNIFKWGFDRYVDYINNKWKLKIVK